MKISICVKNCDCYLLTKSGYESTDARDVFVRTRISRTSSWKMLLKFKRIQKFISCFIFPLCKIVCVDASTFWNNRTLTHFLSNDTSKYRNRFDFKQCSTRSNFIPKQWLCFQKYSKRNVEKKIFMEIFASHFTNSLMVKLKWARARYNEFTYQIKHVRHTARGRPNFISCL